MGGVDGKGTPKHMNVANVDGQNVIRVVLPFFILKYAITGGTLVLNIA